MFRNLISQMPLTDDFANDFFEGKIWGDSYNGDTTLIATLRALVYPRMGPGDSIRVIYRTLRSSFPGGARNPLEAIDVSAGDEYANSLTIVNVCSSNDTDRSGWFGAFPKSFVEKNPGWVRIEKVTNLFARVFSVDCYVNEEYRQSVVFADMIDARKFHYIQCGVLGFVPWYFDPSKGVSELEMNLCKALREKTSEQYEACIAKIAEQYNLSELRLRKMLDGFELRYERMELERTNQVISEKILKINEMQARISAVLKEKNDLEIRALGLSKRISDGGEDSDILELFLGNPRLLLRKVTDASMVFVAREELAIFNEETARMLIDNKDSYLYHPDTDGSRIIPYEDMKRFAEAVFIDQRVKIRMCAAYQFDLNGGVAALGGYEYPSECSGYLPNPHIHHYSCLGSYSRYINELLSKRDYIGAICQCIASARSVNLSEGPTMIKFMRSLYGVNGNPGKIVILPDGSEATVKDACEWLRKEAESAEVSEESEEENG